jgi:hypothetical protein
VLLYQACGTNEDDAMWSVPLARGWAKIHARRLLDGHDQIWPDPRLSDAGRLMLSVRRRRALDTTSHNTNERVEHQS